MIIKKFIIYDFYNKKAKKFDFVAGANIFTSNENSVGKSCVLKSLYYTLGISIKQFSLDWNYDKMLFKIEFEHNGQKGFVVRKNNLFYVSNIEGVLKEKEYSEWMLELLNVQIKLELKNSKDNLKVPYPSAIFLPFYIDQDSSWSKVPYRETVSQLSMYEAKSIPKDIFNSFFGMLDFETFELKSEKIKLQNEKQLFSDQKNALEKIKSKFVDNNIRAIYIDENKLKEDIEIYLRYVSDINKKIASFEAEIYKLERKIDNLKLNIEELNNIYSVTQNNLNNINNVCKECGSHLTIEQSRRRMHLDNNSIITQILISEFQKELDELEFSLNKKMQEKLSAKDEYDNIVKVLNKKYDEISLNDYIEEKSKRLSQSKYMEYILQLSTQINNIDEQIKNIEKKIRKIESNKKNRKNEIETEFFNIINSLEILFPNIDIKNIKFLDFKQISSSGTMYNQMFFCIYIVYSYLLSKFSKVKIPVGFDSPIKDELSGQNSKNIYTTIEKYILKSNLQSFTVMLEDKIQYLKDKEEYNLIHIDKPVLNSEDFENLTHEFDFLLQSRNNKTDSLKTKL